MIDTMNPRWNHQVTLRWQWLLQRFHSEITQYWAL